MTENRLTDKIRQNIKQVIEQVEISAKQANRDVSDITIMAVTKNRSIEEIQCCFDMGLKVVGENRVQELMGKLDFFKNNKAEVHLIGHLQKNKVKYVVGEVDYIDSVDSVELLEAIDKKALQKNVVQKIMIEVNIGDDPNKWGIGESELLELLLKAKNLAGIKVMGLMTILPIEDQATTEKLFLKMSKLFIDIEQKKLDNINMYFLSMGMSDDFDSAILCGSNVVRIGSSLFK